MFPNQKQFPATSKFGIWSANVVEVEELFDRLFFVPKVIDSESSLKKKVTQSLL